MDATLTVPPFQIFTEGATGLSRCCIYIVYSYTAVLYIEPLIYCVHIMYTCICTVESQNNRHIGPGILSFIERLSSLWRLKCTSIIVKVCPLYGGNLFQLCHLF